jgi:putative transposase
MPEEIQRAWKVEIDPTDAQARILARSVGTARWVYNWTLSLRQLRSKTGAPWEPDLKPLIGGATPKKQGKSYDYYSALRTRVDSGEEPLWVKESLSAVGRREAQVDVKSAYDHALRRRKEGKKGKAIGWPKFRKRTHTKFWYSVSGGGQCGIDRRSNHDYVTLTGVPKPIKVKERRYLPIGIPLATVAYSRHAGRHFLSITANVRDPGPRGTHARGEVGIDVGIKTTLVLSDGRRYSAPKPLKDAEKALARARRAVSRKYEARKARNGITGRGKALGPMGSTERKNRDRVASLEARVSRLRSDWQHKISTMLVKKYSLIRIEGLSLKALARGRGAKSWADIGWGEIRRQKAPRGLRSASGCAQNVAHSMTET